MVSRPTDIYVGDRYLGASGRRVVRAAGTVGAAALLVAALLAALTPDGWPQFLHAYLVSYSFVLSLALGALFFVLLQHLARAGWSVVLRRLAESIAGSLSWLALLSVPVLVGMHELYPWSRPEVMAADHLLQGKHPYLNPAFFVIRVAIYLAVWILLARYFGNTSARQDYSGDVGLTVSMQKFSGPGMVLYGVTVTFLAFDLLMSQEPNWFSTVFGVYYFSGSVVGFFALLVVVAVLVQRSSRLTRAITAEHYHDLGKLVFAFVVFWAYIAFSQYMLIWYANIPEETVWFLRRQTGEWAAVGLLLLFGHFVVPFLILVSRYAKRRRGLLVVASAWVLAMHWVDMYWLVMPGAGPGSAASALQELLCLVGLGGLFVAAVVGRMGKHALIPQRDPRLVESLTFENV